MAGDSQLLDLDVTLAEYVNVPPSVATVMSAKPELIGPLSTVLGLEDLHDVLEVIRVDAYNRRMIRRAVEKKQQGQG